MDILAGAEALAVLAGCLAPALYLHITDQASVQFLPVVGTGLVAAIIVAICLRAWGMYDTQRVSALPQKPWLLFAALALACIGVAGLGLPARASMTHAGQWHLTWLLFSFTLIAVMRCLAGTLFGRWAAAGAFDLRIAVFGAGDVARRVREHVSNACRDLTFVGAYDDRFDGMRLGTLGMPISGTLNDLIALGRADGVDQIIIALPASASARIEEVARKLEQLPVSLHVVTHMASDLIGAGPALSVSAVGPIGLLDVKSKPLSDWQPILKRVEDYVIALVLTIIAMPLFVLIAIAIKLDDRGPVLFIQRRRGLNQHIINVLKFRTMRVMEDGAVVKQATSRDPRVTRIGGLLRRTSLDELPQLFNVLRGEMSLVGPRPHAIAHDDYYGDLVERYVNRHQVKPGITGLAQVRGLRGETRTEDKMQSRIDADIEYINNWSLWLDMKILAGTLRTVIAGANAY